MVFNDLKGLLLFHEELKDLKPTTPEVSARAGQWIGLEMQLHRYILALIHELLRLLREYECDAKGPQIGTWLRKGPKSVRKQWSGLLGVALGGRGSGDQQFLKTLVQIRNNAVSHYYQPKLLVRGFRAHFYDTPRAAANEHAYVSLGKNMEHTRFYFADAAIERTLGALISAVGEKEFAKRVVSLGADINHALEFVLARHVDEARRR
ncbi:MAG: hypothetical protein ACYC3L_16500 [Gemmatimonadaceae bacterium]